MTLSKAFGVYGGAILCDAALRSRIIAASRMFAGNTPLPLPLANGALASINLLRRDDSFRHRLARNVDYVKSALRNTELAAPETPAPIIPLIPRDARETKALRKRLLSHGIFPSFILISRRDRTRGLSFL